MASTLPPVKGAAFTFYISLVSQADTDIFKTSVTLAEGDVKVSKGGGAVANIATLPVEIGTSGILAVALSTDETDADRVVVLFHDAAGSEWQDALVTIYTGAQTFDTTDGIADDVKTAVGAAGAGLTAIPKTGYKLASDGLDSVAITAPAGVAANFREMIVQTWRHFFGKVTMTATQIKHYDDAGTGTVTTQTVADDGTTMTQGKAT